MEMCVTTLNQAECKANEGSCCCALIGNSHWLLALSAESGALGKVGKFPDEHVGARKMFSLEIRTVVDKTIINFDER